jgi:succinoglycan biosynthesis protein ExoM
MTGPIRIDVGVCTFRRPQLEQTLRSLGGLHVPAGVVLRVIVADNDSAPSARTLVYGLAAALPFEIRYVHCPASNISLARNACLEAANGDFLIFMDDDQEVVSSDWLTEFLSVANATRADAVLGPVLAVYGEEAPRWMREGDFHSTFPVHVDGRIRTGYSGNALLRLASPVIAGRRFSLPLGRSGGEDTDYFTRLHRDGGRIAYASGAAAREPVPVSRASFAWLAKRRFRSGQTHGRLVGEGLSRAAVARPLMLAAAKAGYCFGAAAVAVFSPVRRNQYALRGVLHAGAVAGMLGMDEIQQYGTGFPVEAPTDSPVEAPMEGQMESKRHAA